MILVGMSMEKQSIKEILIGKKQLIWKINTSNKRINILFWYKKKIYRKINKNWIILKELIRLSFNLLKEISMEFFRPNLEKKKILIKKLILMIKLKI